MSIQKFWYIKQGDAINGPFPAGVITQYLLLGRVTPMHVVSLDKLTWLPISDFEELLPAPLPEQTPGNIVYQKAPQWQDERIMASRRWVDERTGERRLAQLPTAEESGKRRKKLDRRMIESTEIRALRKHFFYHPLNRPFRLCDLPLLPIFLGLSVFAGLLFFYPVNPVKVDLGPIHSDCKQAAKPQVNWTGCDMQGVWLRGVNLSSSNLNHTNLNSVELSNSNLSYVNLAHADISYGNLNNAKLLGANLQQANLSYAELRGADLSQADLSGAKLEAVAIAGAKLDNTVWPDGTICAPGSIGQCLPKK